MKVYVLEEKESESLSYFYKGYGDAFTSDIDRAGFWTVLDLAESACIWVNRVHGNAYKIVEKEI